MWQLIVLLIPLVIISMGVYGLFKFLVITMRGNDEPEVEDDEEFEALLDEETSEEEGYENSAIQDEEDEDGD